MRYTTTNRFCRIVGPLKRMTVRELFQKRRLMAVFLAEAGKRCTA